VKVVFLSYKTEGSKEASHIVSPENVDGDPKSMGEVAEAGENQGPTDEDLQNANSSFLIQPMSMREWIKTNLS